MDSVLSLHPAASGSILGVSGEIYSVDVAEIHRQHSLLRIKWTVQKLN